MDRLATLRAWLKAELNQDFTLSDAIGDASSRRYFRVTLEGGQRYIAMDAPPPGQNCRPFITIADLLSVNVHVPRIFASDIDAGFLLLEDLGAEDYQTALGKADLAQAQKLYLAAIDSLIAIQLNTPHASLPVYDAATMTDDLNRFSEWYADRHLGMPLTGADLADWERSRALLVSRAQAQPKVCVHFDFHCRNLLAGERPGIIDFQDARLGPLAYDLASLLKDVYITWPEDFRLDLCIRYWDKARKVGLPVPGAFDDFFTEYEWMGVFRHLRTLGTFARLAHRDGKTRYLDDMPAALAYLRETCARYAELHPLYKLLNRLTGVQTTVGFTF